MLYTNIQRLVGYSKSEVKVVIHTVITTHVYINKGILRIPFIYTCESGVA